MAKQSFYKGATGVWEESRIVSDYIKGIHMVSDGRGGRKRELIKEGMTKYNRQLLEMTNALTTEYGALMSCEYMLVALVGRHAETSWGIANNVHNIMYAQKGTLKFFSALRIGLKQYQVRDQDIYDAIRHDLKRTKERRERNAEFLDTFAADCGLTPLVDVVRKVFNQSLFECTMGVVDEYKSENLIEDGETVDEYRARVENYYADWVEKLLAENGYNAEALIKAREAECKEHWKERAAQMREEKITQRHEANMVKAKELLDVEISNIMQMIRTANADNKFNHPTFLAFMKHLNAAGGHAWFIAVLKRSRLTYSMDISEMQLSSSIMNMHLYTSKKEAETDAQKIQEALPQAAVIVESITITEKLAYDHDTDRSYTEVQKARQTERIRNVLENNIVLSDTSYYLLENILLLNGMSLIYIGAAGKKGDMYLGSTRRTPVKLVDNVKKCTFYKTMQEAEDAFEEHKGYIIKEGYEPFINVLDYSSGLPGHTVMKQKWQGDLDAFMEYLQTTIPESFCYENDVTYFAHRSQKDRLFNIIEEKPIYIISEYNRGSDHLSWLQISNHNCICDVVEAGRKPDYHKVVSRLFRRDILESIVYADATPIGLTAMERLFETQCKREYGVFQCRPAMLIKISRKGGRYTWEMMKNNMGWQ